MTKLASEALKIERLDVSQEIALEMFKENPFKREQLPNISSQSNGIVTLYRVGDHIDISRGPMISNTSFVGRNKIAAAHKVSTSTDQHNIYRVQGVALPSNLSVSAFAFDILANRASKLVSRISDLKIQKIITAEFHSNRTQKRLYHMRKSKTITKRPSFNKVLISNLKM